MNSVNSEVYADVSVIISMMPTEMKNKISNSFITFIENNKASNYISSINPKIPIKDQNIRKETKEMLGIIYRDYLCSDEERKKMIEKEQEEIAKFEEEFREKYNPNNIFKNKPKEQKYEKEKENVAMVEYKKETFFDRIKMLFTKIFKKY